VACRQAREGTILFAIELQNQKSNLVQKQMNASLLNLHEDEVPQFEDVGIILVHKSGGISGRKMNRCDRGD
jgi:hypothetical protein